ncbi:YqeG family HAD IIIA-type phosphatase [Listeria booriae]|uniref:YqeG family HAD IIIA-type phosphatase n=1 Tax=Listeria booriae TaxID=1552123 RepID=UPI0016241163|nr:YqeG family HAD IIIA-type phosphatase [Listeria booriae]MBC2303464.1 YqeG family HAD IIIA-type phosphatase [Listeria booriae]
MLKKFSPDKMLTSPFGITADQLRKMGKTTVLTDLDNTLLAWDQLDATDEISNWFRLLEEEGIKVMIVSNNNEERVKRVAIATKIPYLAKAKKPLATAFQQALADLGSTPEETVMIGDQIMTDIFGGNRQRLTTIFVRPVKDTDGFATKFNRFMERIILKKLAKKSESKWEDSL